MTDTMPEQTDTEDWGDVEQSADSVTYPEYPANPHNHRYTISMNGQGPMLVVRANTAAEFKQACEEIEDPAVGAAMGRMWAAFKAGAALGNGLGATPVPQGPAAPANFANPGGHFNVPQDATPPPFGPNVSVPQAPGYAGAPVPPAPPAPAAPAPAVQAAPQGWYRLNVPFQQSEAFKNHAAQSGLTRGNPGRGHFNFWKAPTKAWYCAPEVVQYFGQYQPVPA